MRLRWFIRIMFVVAAGYMALLTIFVFSPDSDAVSRAIVKRAWGLFLLWVIMGGALTLRYRERIRQYVLSIATNWQIKFVVFATILALVEELITTGMTNLAPFFGVKMGEAYITASANYFEVIFFHSVIVFIPMFIGWEWLLGRYDFSPNAVFLLFGVTGTLAKWIAFGVSSPISFAFWLFVYGLMVYLPTYSLPPNRVVRQVRFWHIPVAIVFPIICSVPVAIIINLINQARHAS